MMYTELLEAREDLEQLVKDYELCEMSDDDTET